MTLSKTNITNLANSLAHSLGGTNTLSEAYDRVLDRLARTSSPLVTVSAFTPTDGTKAYNTPTGAAKLLAVFARPDGSSDMLELYEAQQKDLEALDITWRDTQTTEGDPIAYTKADETGGFNYINLFPTPDTTVASGGNYLYADNAETSAVPEHIILPIVYEILAEEFAYPSAHQDMEFSVVCREVAALLSFFIGI
jgi:hypothetical protein